jgi:hypothetical protein
MGERWYLQIDEKVVKIPWRYNRPMITVNGIKSIYEYQIGHDIKAEISVKKWGDTTHYILKSITDV